MTDYERLHKQALEYRKIFTPGTRIILTKDLNDPYTTIPAGTKGTIKHVDDISQIHTSWDTGSTLAINPDEDEFRKLTELEITTEKTEYAKAHMMFYIGEECGSGMEFKTKEEFFNALSESIDEAAKRGQKWFTITIENESDSTDEESEEVNESDDTIKYYLEHKSNRRCCKCDKPVLLSDNEEYTYQCLNCDEDLYQMETYKKEHDLITSDELDELFLAINKMLGDKSNEYI